MLLMTVYHSAGQVHQNHTLFHCCPQDNLTKEQRNKGTKEQRNKGTKEQRNKVAIDPLDTE